MVKRKNKNEAEDTFKKQRSEVPLRQSRRQKPEETAKFYVSKGEDQGGLEERFINEFIGRGVFAKQEFKQGSYLLEYVGNKITGAESQKVEDTNYTYHFAFKGKKVCIDATEEPKNGPKLGRLVNHAEARMQLNSVMKIMELNGEPHLCLYSIRNIQRNEEIRYDYGVRNLPWLQKAKNENKHEHKKIEEENNMKKIIDEITESVQDGYEEELDLNTNIKENVREARLTSEKDKDDETNREELPISDLNLVSDGGCQLTVPDNISHIQADDRDTSEVIPIQNENQHEEKKIEEENSLKKIIDDITESVQDGYEEELDLNTNITEDVREARLTSEKDKDDETNREELLVQPIGDLDLVSDCGSQLKVADNDPDFEPSDHISVSQDDDRYTSGVIPIQEDVREARLTSEKDKDDETDRGDLPISDLDLVSDSESQFTDSDNDPDFEPSDHISDSQDDDSDTSEVIPIQQYIKNSTTEREEKAANTQPEKERKVTKTQDLKHSYDYVTVPGTTAYKDGHRVVDKYHNCIFCGKLQLRIARHLQTVHKNEKTVLEVTSKCKKEKMKGLDKLRLDGDYNHNIKVLKENQGFLILARRPSASNTKQYTSGDFLPCEFCLGFYLKSELWRHRQSCQFAPQEKGHSRVQRNGILLLESSMLNKEEIHQGFKDNVISTLLVDDISLIVRKDKIILKVGENLYLKHGKQQKQYISQEIRLLGRLVKTLRKTTGNENGYLEEFLKPINFDAIVEAAQSLSGKEETNDTCSFKTPSVALKCGPVLKKCCIVLKGYALRQSDEIGEKNAERLLKLIEEEWKHKVTAVALRSIKETKRNEQVLLPTTSDLLKLKDFLDVELKDAAESMKFATINMENFQRLSAAILCRVMMLNRRRSGETSKILLKDYENRPQWHSGHNAEIINSLSLTEQKLMKRLDMIEIRGKRGRNVCLILTPDIRTAIDQLIKARSVVGINDSNLYLFPRSNGDSHIDGHVCMRSFASRADLEHPERVGSTSMRKYIATVIQMMNLNDGELEWLSNHLGHSINVHREYYRNQESAIELGKVAKMLLAVDQGQALDKVKAGATEDTTCMSESESESESDEEENNLSPDAIGPPIQDLERQAYSNTNEDSSSKKKTIKTKWTTEEVAAIKRQFGKNYRLLVVPNKADCDRAMKQEQALTSRDWKAIKYKVHNDIQRLKKK